MRPLFDGGQLVVGRVVKKTMDGGVGHELGG
jgi:hypothetical protein